MAALDYSVRGMNDLLPHQAPLWDAAMAKIALACACFGFDRIDFPIVAPTQLFRRAIGDVTDIVEKEMYAFTDPLSGDDLTLRPEGTACCLRSVMTHNLAYARPQRLWYHGPMFRHERPQKGRYRQFYQVGIECFGFDGEEIELELILLASFLWRDLGISEKLTLHVNTLGNMRERQAYRQVLVDYFSGSLDQLDADSQRRLHRNPFRILDSKNPAMETLIADAPLFFDYLEPATKDAYQRFLAHLTTLGLSYHWNQRLVRGLDYYNGLVFEWMSGDGAQSTVCAGGRYDGLAEQLGYKHLHAVGCAMGLERLLSLCSFPSVIPTRLYAVHGDADSFFALHRLAHDLRDSGWSVIVHPGQASWAVQMKKAHQLGCFAALLLGSSERAEGVVGVKFLATGVQQKVAPESLGAFLTDYLKG